MKAIAEARTNIALIKYWGKRDPRLNLPAVGSLSLTLDGLATRTEVRFEPGRAHDSLLLNGEPAAEAARVRVARFLELVRERAGLELKAQVVSCNDFPTAAGLASSASAFAALALAATRAAELTVDGRALSILARRGSGSAARSIFGGLVRMHRGERDDGQDAFAEPLLAADAWDLRMVVAITHEGPKATLSTDGMSHTRATSPYYEAWVGTSAADLADAEAAISARDLERLGTAAERSCLTMHASALAARPAVVYFRGATIEGYRAVVEMRNSGLPAWFSCDAGPHVKALTDAAHAEQVAARLAAVPGVLRTQVCAPGRGAEVLENG